MQVLKKLKKKLREMLEEPGDGQVEGARLVDEQMLTTEDPSLLEPDPLEVAFATKDDPNTFTVPDGVEVTPDFKAAFAAIDSGAPFVFITGRAGTGKSTFVGLLKEHIKSHAVVAPTGVAALNVGGQTIHSFFRLPPGPIEFSKLQPVKNKIAYKALRAVIIDEISMVRADLLDAIDVMLRLNGPNKDQPFGGVQIIGIGDLFQLPPVVDSEEEAAFLAQGYKSPFFFSAKVLAANSQLAVPLKLVEFTKIFRQQDQDFIELLNNIREGRNIEPTLTALNERVAPLIDRAFPGIILTATNNQASAINSSRLSELESQAHRYTGTITGEFRLDKSKLPAPLELDLKEGASIMFVKNDPQKRWVNGTLGKVVTCLPEQIRVGLTDAWGYREVSVERISWDNLKYQYDPDLHEVTAQKVGSYEQFPLTLAWAVTIHKAQGKTFDKIHIALGNAHARQNKGGAFAPGQLYVALSRARTLEGISLEIPILRDDVILSFEVVGFLRRGRRECSQYLN